MEKTENRRPQQAEIYECDAMPVEHRQSKPRREPRKEAGMPWWLTGIALVIGCFVLLKFFAFMVLMPLRLLLVHPVLVVGLLIGAGLWAYYRGLRFGITSGRRHK